MVRFQGAGINHDSENKFPYAGAGVMGILGGKLSRQGSSVESTHSANIHVHTPECISLGHPTHQPKCRGSPTGEQKECDFHCCSLHEENRRLVSSRPHVKTQMPKQRMQLHSQQHHINSLQPVANDKRYRYSESSGQKSHSQERQLPHLSGQKHVHIQPTVQVQLLPRADHKVLQSGKQKPQPSLEKPPPYLETTTHAEEQYYLHRQHLQQLQKQLQQQHLEIKQMQGRATTSDFKPTCKIHDYPCNCY